MSGRLAKPIKPYGTAVSAYTGPQSSRPFERWWAIANDRRQTLVVREHKKGDLSHSQKRELEMLQKVADLVLKYKPFCCTHDDRRVCCCRCHLVGHKHKRDSKGRCSICLENLQVQKEFFKRQKRADKLLAIIEKNGGL